MDNQQTSQKYSILSTVLCTIALSGNIGNVYRLPQMTIIRGGLPFLVSYLILMILMGLPLLFLKLSIGRLAQEGLLKSWRAVPLFKGVVYVKSIAAYLLAIYHPIYMTLSIFEGIWMIAHQDREIGVKILEPTGQEYMKSLLLVQTFDESISMISLFVYAVFLINIWIVTLNLILICFKLVPILIIFFFPVFGFFIALITNMALQINESSTLLNNFLVNDVDWNELSSANTWYFAAIQVFFSTNIGLGLIRTNAGIMYNKVNPLWTALGYILGNLIFGIGSIFITQTYIGHINVTKYATGDIAELKLMSLMHDAAVNNINVGDWFLWGAIFHFFVAIATFINFVTLNYRLSIAVKDKTGQNENDGQIKINLCPALLGVVAGIGLVLYPDFGLVHLLDHYIVGNLILITVVLQVFSFLAFYDLARIRSDFEFMFGQILSKIWIILWWCNPILLTAIFAWALATLPLKDIYKDDPLWMYVTGWGVILNSIIFIFVVGILTLKMQSGNTLLQKLKQSLEPSSKCGPIEPIQRHN